jgi:hypothetical protein
MVMYVLDFPLCLRDFFGEFFYPVFVVSIEAAPALGVPYGNDLEFPGVFGKWYLYSSRRALLHIGVGLMGWCPGT